MRFQQLLTVVIIGGGLSVADVQAQVQEVPEQKVTADTSKLQTLAQRVPQTLVPQKHARRRRELRVTLVCLAIVASALVLFNVRSR